MKKIIFMIVVLFFIWIGIFKTDCTVMAATNDTPYLSEVNVSAKRYESTTDCGYDISQMQLVNNFAHGNAPIAKLKVKSYHRKKTTKEGRDLIGIGLSSFSFSVGYSGEMLSGNQDQWVISEDSGNVFLGETYTGSINKGAMLITMSNTDEDYETSGTIITNFFENADSDSFYSASTYNQMYFRVYFGYQTKKKIDGKFVYYYNLELYDFVVVYDDSSILFHNYGLDAGDVDIDGFEYDVISKAETLTNNSVTTSGVTLDFAGKNVDVYYYLNGKRSNNKVYNGMSFIEDGRYDFVVTNLVGTESRVTIYVFKRSDKGFSTYFYDPIIFGERLLSDNLYPTYTSSSSFCLKGISDNIPPLIGNINNLDSGDSQSISTNTDDQYFSLEPGTYRVILNMRQTNSGTYYKYTITFVIDEQELALPSHNYNILYSRCNLEDLGFKHFEVVYQMTQGGYIHVCFSMDSYDEALSYATAIEARFIEHADDGYYYYKSLDNPNKKEKYMFQVDAYAAAREYAKKNVEINYFNPLDSITYNTVDYLEIDNLESLNENYSIRVFPSEEEKEKIICRMPYINNFMFVQVADYDVTEVTAYCKKTGQTINIEFGIPVVSQLFASSVYTITEKNIYGHTRTYDVYFEKENMTISTWDFSTDGNTVREQISFLNIYEGKYEVTCDSAILRTLSNELDDNTIVVIKAPGVYSYEIKFLISEIKQFELYKKGTYNVTIVDRLSNSYTIIINITGKTRYNRIENNTLTLTGLYNSLFLNRIDDSNELILDDSDLYDELTRYVDPSKYSANTFENYMSELSAALVVYNNPDATQIDLDNATSRIREAFALLVLLLNKDDLKKYLDYIAGLVPNDYTPTSYNDLYENYLNALLVYEESNVTQITVDNITNLLVKKISLLVGRANLVQLSNIIKEVEKIDENMYALDSIKELRISLGIAQETIKDLNVSQDEVDLVYANLKSTMENLVLVGDKTKIINLINTINNIEYEIYTSASIKSLKTTYDYVVEKANTGLSQSEIDYLYESLNESYKNLEQSKNRIELRAILEGKDLSKKEVQEAYTKLYDMDTSEEEIMNQIDIVRSIKGNNNNVILITLIVIVSVLVLAVVVIIVVWRIRNA